MTHRTPEHPVPDERPHLAYIAWGYPPARGSGVYRAVATANEFVRSGWRVTVITADRESFEKYTSADVRLEELIDPAIDVLRVPFIRPYLEDDLADWSRMRMESPLVWGMAVAKLDRWHFPEKNYARWYPRVVTALRRLHSTTPVDLVIGTANPQVDAAAARALHPHVSYIVDYRDAWLLDVFTGERLHSRRSREARWERRLFRDAQEIWFVNDPIRNWHAEEYPGAGVKMVVVPNGSDLDLPSAGQPRERGGRPMRFTYLGTITPNVPLALFGEGWRLAHGQIPDSEARIHGHLGFFEKPISEERALIDQITSIDGVRYRGPVSKMEVGQVYAAADVLLLIIGGGQYVTSGKLYEYISTGLPIVSVHDPDSAASTVLRDYPLWFPARELTAPAVSEALLRAYAAVVQPDREKWREAAAWADSTRRSVILGDHVRRLTNEVGLT